MAAIGEDDGFSSSAAGHIDYFAVVSAIVNDALGGGGIGGGYGYGPIHCQYIAESNVNQFNAHLITS
jgi:hypothetical protein